MNVVFFPNVFYLKMLAHSFFCQVRVYQEKEILKQRELRDEGAGPWLCVIQLEYQTVCTDKSKLMLFILAFGNTTWWEKLKVWRLEINENIIELGSVKGRCLFTNIV